MVVMKKWNGQTRALMISLVMSCTASPVEVMLLAQLQAPITQPEFTHTLSWCCLLSPLLLGGVAWPPSLNGVALFPLLFAWCSLPFPPSLGGARFSPLFCWVVLSTFSSFRWGCFPSLFSWVVLLGLLRWVVLRYSLSFCVVLPPFPTLFGRVSFKKKNQKNRKKKLKTKIETKRNKEENKKKKPKKKRKIKI